MNTSNRAASNSLEILRESALRGIDQKYDGQLKDLALLRIEEELSDGIISGLQRLVLITTAEGAEMLFRLCCIMVYTINSF